MAFLCKFTLGALKSVNFNFTLAVHSPKFNQAKAHFLSHVGEKKRKNMARPGFEPSRDNEAPIFLLSVVVINKITYQTQRRKLRILPS